MAAEMPGVAAARHEHGEQQAAIRAANPLPSSAKILVVEDNEINQGGFNLQVQHPQS
jgi:hypothetical protein